MEFRLLRPKVKHQIRGELSVFLVNV